MLGLRVAGMGSVTVAWISRLLAGLDRNPPKAARRMKEYRSNELYRSPNRTSNRAVHRRRPINRHLDLRQFSGAFTLDTQALNFAPSLPRQRADAGRRAITRRPSVDPQVAAGSIRCTSPRTAETGGCLDRSPQPSILTCQLAVAALVSPA